MKWTVVSEAAGNLLVRDVPAGHVVDDHHARVGAGAEGASEIRVDLVALVPAQGKGVQTLATAVFLPMFLLSLPAGVIQELARLVLECAGARVLVLSGLPRAFSAGVSVAEHFPDPKAIEEMLAGMRSALNALVRTPAVTVAAVSGACLGGGAELAAACDVVLTTEDSRIGFPEIRLACFPPGAAALLPVRIGGAR